MPTMRNFEVISANLLWEHIGPLVEIVRRNNLVNYNY